MWGSILFSDSIDDVKDAIANHFQIVALVDDQQKYQQYGFVTMGVLLPPEQSIFAEIENRYEEAEQLYLEYLNTTVIEQITALLAALLSGKNLMLYLPMDESMNFKFIQVFSRFFQSMFGITIGSTAVDSSMTNDPVTMQNIANVLYSFNFIPFELYCSLMPIGGSPSEAVCAKMLQSINYNFNNMNECVAYCIQYIANEKEQQRLKDEGNTMINPVFRVNKS